MSLVKLLTSLQFTASEWASLVRCALKDQPADIWQPPPCVQLESRTLYSASPIDVVTDVETDVSDDLAVQAAAVDESLLAEESQPAAEAKRIGTAGGAAGTA